MLSPTTPTLPPPPAASPTATANPKLTPLESLNRDTLDKAALAEPHAVTRIRSKSQFMNDVAYARAVLDAAGYRNTVSQPGITRFLADRHAAAGALTDPVEKDALDTLFVLKEQVPSLFADANEAKSNETKEVYLSGACRAADKMAKIIVALTAYRSAAVHWRKSDSELTSKQEAPHATATQPQASRGGTSEPPVAGSLDAGRPGQVAGDGADAPAVGTCDRPADDGRQAASGPER